jgi:hypothetical protein
MILAGLGMFAGACGVENTGVADAPPGDAAGDAAPDAEMLGVTVTVTLGGVASPGQTVYFQSRDSVTTETVLTGPDGNATAIVEAGGYVTVIKPEPRVALDAHLSTFAGVKPGDHLFVDVPIQVATPTVSFTINVPNEGPSFSYWLDSTCGSARIADRERPDGVNRAARPAKRPAVAAAPVTATVQLRGCDGMADLLVTISDSLGPPQRWMYRANVPVTEGGTVDFVGEYAALEEQTFTYTARPDTEFVRAGRVLQTAHGALIGGANNRAVQGSMTVSMTLNVPTPPGVAVVTTSHLLHNDRFSTGYVSEWGANDSSYGLDLAAVGLRAYSGEPSYDTQTQEIRWTEGTDGEAPQFAIASILVRRDSDLIWTWDLAAPWTAPKLAYPTLPRTLFGVTPQLNDQVFVERLTTAQVVGGYDAARPRVFSSDREWARVGPAGRVAVENLRILRGPGAIPTEATAAASFRRGGFTRHAR